MSAGVCPPCGSGRCEDCWIMCAHDCGGVDEMHARDCVCDDCEQWRAE